LQFTNDIVNQIQSSTGAERDTYDVARTEIVTELETRPVVSFVLPAFNEGKHIEESLRRLDSSFRSGPLSHEIVVVDDGSIDDTRCRTSYYARKNGHVRIISYRRNMGKGFAVKTGFFQAVGDIIILLDSDLDIDATQAERFIQALGFGDIAIGSKYHPESIVEISLLRRFLSTGFNLLSRLLTGVRARDTQAGIKAIRRDAFFEIFKCLRVKRYAFDVELLALAIGCGLKVVELPVKLKIVDRFRVLDIWHMALDILGIAYRLRIKKYYQHKLVLWKR